MTKKEIINQHERIGYYSGFGGIEIYHIEYGIDDYVYFIANVWYGKKTYCKAKICYESETPYFKYYGEIISFDEIMRG